MCDFCCFLTTCKKLHNSTHSWDEADSLFRACSNCFMLVIVAHMNCTFSKYFQILYIFAQIFKYLPFFALFLENCTNALIFCIIKYTKVAVAFFFDIYVYIAKILSTSYFGYQGHIRLLPSKKIIPTCRNFDPYKHSKMNSIPNF